MQQNNIQPIKKRIRQLYEYQYDQYIFSIFKTDTKQCFYHTTIRGVGGLSPLHLYIQTYICKNIEHLCSDIQESGKTGLGEGTGQLSSPHRAFCTVCVVCVLHRLPA